MIQNNYWAIKQNYLNETYPKWWTRNYRCTNLEVCQQISKYRNFVVRNWENELKIYERDIIQLYNNIRIS